MLDKQQLWRAVMEEISLFPELFFGGTPFLNCMVHNPCIERKSANFFVAMEQLGGGGGEGVIHGG